VVPAQCKGREKHMPEVSEGEKAVVLSGSRTLGSVCKG